MPFNLLLLPLLGGYIFITHWHFTKFEALRAHGYHLLLKSALAGVVFLSLSYCLGIALEGYFQNVKDWWVCHIPFEYSGTALFSLLIGMSLWKPLNLFFYSEKASDKAIVDRKDALELLLWEAQWPPTTLLVTLRTGKVYIGWFISGFNPAYEMQSISLAPALSGYRDKRTQRITFTEDYLSVYDKYNCLLEKEKEEGLALEEAEELERIEPDNFKISIPVTEIVSVSHFDIDVYQKYFIQEEDRQSAKA